MKVRGELPDIWVGRQPPSVGSGSSPKWESTFIDRRVVIRGRTPRRGAVSDGLHFCLSGLGELSYTLLKLPGSLEILKSNLDDPGVDVGVTSVKETESLLILKTYVKK